MEFKKINDSHQKYEQQYFLNHSDPEIAQLSIMLLHQPYQVSENWLKMHQILVTQKSSLVQRDFESLIYMLKIELVNQKIRDIDKQITSAPTEEEMMQHIATKQKYLELKKKIALMLGSVII